MFERTATPARQAVLQTASPNTNELLNLAQRHGWKTQMMGRGPMLRTPLWAHGWQLVPLQWNTSPLPQHAQDKIAVIAASGVRLQGFVVVNEPRAAMARPTQSRIQMPPHLIGFLLHLPWDRILKVVAWFVFVLAILPLLIQMLMQLIMAVVTAILGILLVPLMLIALMGAVAVDPMLVAVTADGYWVMIDRWWD